MPYTGDTIDEAGAEIERLREIEYAAKAVIEDDCDGVIHPLCWERLRNSLNPTTPTETC